jgi:hypothetical protein
MNNGSDQQLRPAASAPSVEPEEDEDERGVEPEEDEDERAKQEKLDVSHPA